MQRRRTIAGSPIRSASDAWRTAVSLISNTLERSDAIDAGSVAVELACLDGLGPALVAGGHLQDKGLVLVDEGLHLTIVLPTADAALDIDENLNPVPGGAGATKDWTLYVPDVEPLATALSDTAAKSSHVSLKTPPSEESKSSVTARSALLDVAALQKANNDQ